MYASVKRQGEILGKLNQHQKQSIRTPVRTNKPKRIMISDESVAITIKIISAGNTCSFLPMKWDSSENALVVNRTWRHRLVQFLVILEYCFLVGYSALNYTVKSQYDLIVVLFIWGTLTCTFLILFWLNWNCYSFVSMWNAAFCLNSVQSKLNYYVNLRNNRYLIYEVTIIVKTDFLKFCILFSVKMLQIQEVTKDGFEIYLKYIWRVSQFFWITFPFHFYIFIETETSIGKVWRFEFGILKFAGITGITVLFSISILSGAIIVSSILIYISMPSQCFKRLSRSVF